MPRTGATSPKSKGCRGRGAALPRCRHGKLGSLMGLHAPVQDGANLWLLPLLVAAFRIPFTAGDVIYTSGCSRYTLARNPGISPSLPQEGNASYVRGRKQGACPAVLGERTVGSYARQPRCYTSVLR